MAKEVRTPLELRLAMVFVPVASSYRMIWLALVPHCGNRFCASVQ
jgi:hypothetical protein